MGADELSGRGPVTSGPRERFRFGIDGVGIEPGDHICCFYSGLAERDRILLPYLRAGVRDGDKCVCLIDATDSEAMRAKINHRHQASPKQLVIEAATHAYLHQGRFSRDYMVAIWTRPCTPRSYPIASRSSGPPAR